MDNGSSDGIVAEAADRYPSVRVIRNEVNLGFATASNVGASLPEGRYLLFMNSDAIVDATALSWLMQIANFDLGVAIWQPVIMSPDGEVENAGEFFTRSGFFIRRRTVLREESAYPVFACTAACALMRRDVFRQLGGFVDAYFAYIEDVDLCWRARLAGWEVQVVPSVRVTHVQGITSRRVLTAHEIRYLTVRNRLRSILANASRRTLVNVVPLYYLACGITALVLLLSGRVRSAYSVMRALAWPMRHKDELLVQRRAAQALRKRTDEEVLRPDLTSRVLTKSGWRQFREHYRRWKPIENPSSEWSDGLPRRLVRRDGAESGVEEATSRSMGCVDAPAEMTAREDRSEERSSTSAAARAPRRVAWLNLGSGPFPAPGWINIDLVADRRPNVVASVLAPPFVAGSIDRVYAGHVFEHLEWETAIAGVTMCHSLLREGGEMLIVGPDLDRASWMAQGGEISLAEFDSCLFGGDAEAMGHKWGAVGWRWHKLALSGGFTTIRALPIESLDDSWPIVSRIGSQAALLCTRARATP